MSNEVYKLIHKKALRKPITMILVSPTHLSLRNELVPEIIESAPEGLVPAYSASKRVFVWPNGSKALLTTSTDTDRIRGVQAHFSVSFGVSRWESTEALTQLGFCTRLGKHPEVLALY